MKLSIVVPCYNEVENLTKLLSAYKEVITRNDIEVVLVNNGSTDNTEGILNGLEPDYYPWLKIVTVPKNQGYGFGILEGLRSATGEFIGWTHGDLQTPPQDIVSALSIIESSKEPKKLFIKGNRVGRPLFDKFFTKGMSLFESVYFGVKMNDINAQPNVFHRSFFETWSNPPHDFALDLYVFYKAIKADLKVVRFKVQFPKRQHGVSKWNTSLLSKWKFIKRTINFSFELKRNNLN